MTRIALACALLMGPLQPSAVAQDGGPFEPQPGPAVRSHRVGPFLVSPTVSLRDLGIDSNVYNVAAPAPDVTFTIVPVVNATTRAGRAAITLSSATDFVYFAKYTSERSMNESLAIIARVPAGRMAFTGAASYVNTRQRPTEEIDARSRRVVPAGEAGVELSLTSKLSGGLKTAFTRTRFDADAVFNDTFLAHELNREAGTLTGSLRYAATRLAAVSVSTVLRKTRFLEAPVRDADVREVLLGIELHPRALIAGTVSVGHQRFRPRDSSLPSFDGVVGFVDVSYRLGTGTIIGLGGGRNLDYSYFETQPYYLREGYGLNVRRALASGWDVQLSATRFRHRYRRAGTQGGSDLSAGSDRLAQIAAVTGYQASRAVRFSVAVSYQDRDSAFAGHGYDSLRVGTTASYAF